MSTQKTTDNATLPEPAGSMERELFGEEAEVKAREDALLMIVYEMKPMTLRQAIELYLRAEDAHAKRKLN